MKKKCDHREKGRKEKMKRVFKVWASGDPIFWFEGKHCLATHWNCNSKKVNSNQKHYLITVTEIKGRRKI
jgi:hypothetical protein